MNPIPKNLEPSTQRRRAVSGGFVVNRFNLLVSSALLTVAVTMSSGAAEKAGKAGMSDLQKAHKGTLKIDTEFLNRAPQSTSAQAFFAASHRALEATPKAWLADVPEIRQAAEQNGISHLGGPMLGCVSPEGVRVWVRTVKPAQVTVLVQFPGEERRFGPVASTANSDLTAVVPVTGLVAATHYSYRVLIDGQPIAMPSSAVITTAPAPGSVTGMRIAFGADFHKSGLWHPELMERIRSRGNLATLLLGDLAVDDRKSNVGMHRSDYLLRDLSPYWQRLVASVPVYATWDDHDYFDNDLSGIPPKFTPADRTAVRTVWQQSWNNPPSDFDVKQEGIFFRTRIGPCDVIMLDTRSCRTIEGEANCYLGETQMQWLNEQLLACEGPFIILSSGTMWSDSVSNGKDSWGKWDPAAREHIFSIIEKHKIGAVLLLSGDRHGCRVMKIPRPSGLTLYEFEMGSLGGHEGPPALGTSKESQPFGMVKNFTFGEFTFDTATVDPTVTFRALTGDGNELYQLALTRSQLTPP